MPCIDEWTQKLEGLGLRPVPAHVKHFIKAICAGTSTAETAEFLFRLYSWPARLVELTRLYDLSDEQSKLLQELFLASGESGDFTRTLGKLPRKGPSPQAVFKPRENALEDMSNVNQKMRAQREAEFESAVAQEKDRLGVSELPIDPDELASLKGRYVSRSMSRTQLEKLLTAEIAKKLKR